MRETFVKVQYIVCWAGCNLPLKERCFDYFDDALKFYEQHKHELSLRIEELATKTQIKIVWPENIRRKDL
jgi:hypothetical protein